MLPATYKEFGEKYKNRPFLNIMANMAGIRIYYYKNKYRVFVTTMEGIVPMIVDTALQCSKILNELLCKENNLIDLTIFYPNDIKKKRIKKINELSGEYEQNSYETILRKYLLLLI